MLEHTVPYTSVYRIPYYHLLPHSYRKPHQPQVHVVPDTQAHVGNNPIHISQLDLPGCEQWPEPLSKSSPFVGWQENQIDGWMDGWMLTAYYCISPELTSFTNLIRVCAVLGPGTRLYIYIYIHTYIHTCIYIYTHIRDHMRVYI